MVREVRESVAVEEEEEEEGLKRSNVGWCQLVLRRGSKQFMEEEKAGKQGKRDQR